MTDETMTAAVLALVLALVAALGGLFGYAHGLQEARQGERIEAGNRVAGR